MRWLLVDRARQGCCRSEIIACISPFLLPCKRHHVFYPCGPRCSLLPCDRPARLCVHVAPHTTSLATVAEHVAALVNGNTSPRGTHMQSPHSGSRRHFQATPGVVQATHAAGDSHAYFSTHSCLVLQHLQTPATPLQQQPVRVLLLRQVPAWAQAGCSHARAHATVTRAQSPGLS